MEKTLEFASRGVRQEFEDAEISFCEFGRNLDSALLVLHHGQHRCIEYDTDT